VKALRQEEAEIPWEESSGRKVPKSNTWQGKPELTGFGVSLPKIPEVPKQAIQQMTEVIDFLRANGRLKGKNSDHRR
jgi:hypothetical protein